MSALTDIPSSLYRHSAVHAISLSYTAAVTQGPMECVTFGDFSRTTKVFKQNFQNRDLEFLGRKEWILARMSVAES